MTKKRMMALLPAALLVLGGCGGDDGPSSPGSGNSNDDHVEVVSVSPAHESAGVEGLVELKVEFDRPVSQVVAVLLPEGLGFLSDEWLLKNDDGTVWSKTLNVTSGTEYQLIVIEAIGEDGTRLETPSTTVFTTRETLPQGKIAGKVTTPASTTPTGTIIMVYDANHWEAGFESIFDPDVIRSFGYVDDESGEFEVPYLASGNYYVMALKYDFEESEDGVVQVEDVYLGIYGSWAAIPEFERIDLPANGEFMDADIAVVAR